MERRRLRELWMTLSHLILASSAPVSFFKGWKFSGNFTAIDLVAASANALNGALLARRPDHYKNFTRVGIILMALLGGLSGGTVRDLILGHLPAAFTNPAYIVLCLGFGVIGYQVAYTSGQLFREGIFQFMTSFSLTWFAIVGAQAAVEAHIPVLGCILLAIIAATAGRWVIDVSCSVTPKQFIQGEWFVTDAALTALVWVLTYAASDHNTWIALGVAFVVGFLARSAALWYGWEEPLASEPAGVYKHSNRRPLLGRKLMNKSKQELHDLGLVVDHGTPTEPRKSGGTTTEKTPAVGPRAANSP
jgi:uncharacterized membrane protein YeiH